jgi:hypothetical protein
MSQKAITHLKVTGACIPKGSANAIAAACTRLKIPVISIGPPWTADHKIAAAALLSSLARR